MSRSLRRAFTLAEVLVAIALFGLATAALFTAVAPVQDALFRLSFSTRDAGDLEIVKAMAESSKDRSALLQGGSTALPDGRAVSWRAELEPTATEALFLVRLTADRTGDTALRSEYLHFNPLWMDATGEQPRWLAHTGGGGASAGVSGGGRGGDRPGGAVSPGGGRNRGGDNAGNGRRAGRGERSGGERGGAARRPGAGGPGR